MPSAVRATFGALARQLPMRAGSPNVWDRLVRMARVGAMQPARRYALDLMQFDPWLRQELCTAQFLAANNGADPSRLMVDAYEGADADDELDAMLSVDVNWYLPDALLVKVDIATMAHGLEGRSPLLDHVFMEWAACLPPIFKRYGSTSKYIFKRAIRPLVPTEILDRPKKGFSVPLDRWFRHELRELTEDLLLGQRALERGYFKKATVTRLVSEHVDGVRNWHEQLWNLLMLELWHRTFVDERPSVVGSPTSEAKPICAA
jgi:asparagine synthase (glutamine-hydrolysing)